MNRRQTPRPADAVPPAGDGAAPEDLGVSGPVRTCVGCRRRGSRAELQRWVLVDGVPTPDPGKRLPGRGAWLHEDAECLALATRRQAFRRAFRPRG